KTGERAYLSAPAVIRPQPKMSFGLCVLKLDCELARVDPCMKSLVLFRSVRTVRAQIVIVLRQSPSQVVVSGIISLGLPQSNNCLPDFDQILAARIEPVSFCDCLGRRTDRNAIRGRRGCFAAGNRDKNKPEQAQEKKPVSPAFWRFHLRNHVIV